MSSAKTKKMIHAGRIATAGLAAIAFLTVSFLPPVPTAEAATNATLQFDQSSVSVDVGDPVTLVARVNPGNNEVGAVELDVTFNPSILQLDSITRSSAFNITLAAAAIDNTGTGDTDGNGSIDVGKLADTPPYVTTTSDVATFVFTALAAATDSPVDFAVTSDVSAHGLYVVQTRTGATVTVAGNGEPTYTVGGTISDLDGVVVLQNNGTNDLSVSEDGDFEFTVALADGAAYDVSILTQPIGQTCGVDSGGSGTIDGNDVGGVLISCINIGPWRSDKSPSGELAKGTTQTTLSLATDANATCAFSTTAGTAYGSMTNTFDGAGSTTHTYALTGLSDGTQYSYYVRCEGADLSLNTDDYVISFSIGSDSDHHKKVVEKVKRKLSVSLKRIKRGQTIVESGKRFSKNSNVALYFSKYGGGYYAPKIIKTNSAGKFSLSYRFPTNKPIGTYNWYAKDLKTGRKSKLSYYKIVP